MTYTAELYIGDCLYKTIALGEFVKEYVVLYTHRPLRDSFAEIDAETITMQRNKMIFRVNEKARREQYVIPYIFDSVTGNLRLSQYEVHEVLPTPLDEPNENVNLDKLKAKLRDKLETKELLIRYYRS